MFATMVGLPSEQDAVYCTIYVDFLHMCMHSVYFSYILILVCMHMHIRSPGFPESPVVTAELPMTRTGTAESSLVPGSASSSCTSDKLMHMAPPLPFEHV